MTRANWVELVEILAAVWVVGWLFGQLRFRIYLGELSGARLPERVSAIRQALQALGALLLSCPGGRAKGDCVNEINILRQSLLMSERGEKTARWLVWLRPFHAERMLADAWRVLPRRESELKALLHKVEDQLWRRRPLAATGPSEPSQRAAMLGAVDALLGDAMLIWPALTEDVFSRHKLTAGPSPAALVAQARATGEREPPAAWSDLADAAWLCAAGAEWQRRRIRETYSDQESAVRALSEANRQRTDARKSPPRPDNPKYASLQASFDEAERLFTEGETLLGLLAWHRAEHSLQRAIRHYQRTLGRVSIPMDTSSHLARLLRPGEPRREGEEQDSEESDLDLPDSWPGGDYEESSSSTDDSSPGYDTPSYDTPSYDSGSSSGGGYDSSPSYDSGSGGSYDGGSSYGGSSD